MGKARDLAAVVSAASIADYVKSADSFGARITNNSDSSQGLQVRTSDNDTGQYILDLQSSSSATGTDYASKMVVEKGGNVGIGTAAPVRNFHLHESTSSTAVVFAMSTNGTGATTGDGFNISIDGSSGAVNLIQRENADMIFYTYGGTGERMRILSGGSVVVGDTAEIRANSQVGLSIEPEGRIYMSRGTGTGAFSHLVFYNGNGVVGSVASSGSATAYNTSSDYRLKENVTDVTDGITRVKQLAPKRFNFIADADTTVDGFLAHEAQTVVPEAITGTKDEVDDDGNAVMQGIDQSKLVPLLTAALKEAIAKIETLETKVAALEAE
tara:strand:- start:143 stop:1120 length:978 start_codon:yes stop_codon:yes gene_type:complete